jgi:uncharacterized membrane protein
MAEDTYPSTSRVEAFSDGVIAIIITIMVLDLALPAAAASGTTTENLLWPLMPKLLAYAWSFLVVAIMWVNHHQLMHQVRSARPPVLWANNLLLFWMSLIPLGTRFFGEHPLVPRAVALYGFILFACAGSFTHMRYRIARSGDETERRHMLHRAVIRRSWMGTLIYAASVPLASVSIYLSMLCFVIVPAMFFAPKQVRVASPDERSIEKAHHH